jgi:hypothetical protein
MFFDIGVFLVVLGLVLDILRSLGSEIDRQGDVAAARGSSVRGRAGIVRAGMAREGFGAESIAGAGGMNTRRGGVVE